MGFDKHNNFHHRQILLAGEYTTVSQVRVQYDRSCLLHGAEVHMKMHRMSYPPSCPAYVEEVPPLHDIDANRHKYPERALFSIAQVPSRWRSVGLSDVQICVHRGITRAVFPVEDSCLLVDVLSCSSLSTDREPSHKISPTLSQGPSRGQTPLSPQN